MSAFRPDLVIKDSEGLPVAVVEVKSRRDLSSNVAAEIRHSLLTRGLPAQIPYFLLLSQDVGYLWKTPDNLDAPPAYKFPMDNVITRYSKGTPDRRLYETELELLIFQWLMNLSVKPQNTVEEPEKTLEHAGFNEAIKDAVVLIEEKL
jgi:hypothetical protein